MNFLGMQLWGKEKPDQVRFICMMESGQLVDEMAGVVQTQVIADKSKASIRNRKPVPLYHLNEEGGVLEHQADVIVETGYERPPGEDDRTINEDGFNLWKGLRTGAAEMPKAWVLTGKHLTWTMNIVGAISLLACIAVAQSANSSPAPRVVEPPSIQEIIQEVQDGRDSEDTGASSEDSGTSDAFGGAASREAAAGEGGGAADSDREAEPETDGGSGTDSGEQVSGDDPAQKSR